MRLWRAAAQQIGRAVRRDFAAREDAPQVRNVAVLVLGVVLVFHPLLQLAVLADLVGRDLRAHVGELRAQVAIHVQSLRRRDGFAEQRAHDLPVHRGAHDQAALLGGVAGAGVEVSGLGVLHQGIDEEQRRAFHQRIGGGAQELLVQRDKGIAPTGGWKARRRRSARCRDCWR